jgi:hypothetical protein
MTWLALLPVCFAAVLLAETRRQAGEPWIRMAVILGSVALLTGSAALVFLTQALRKRYETEAPSAERPPRP